MSGSAKVIGSISIGALFNDTSIKTKPKGFNFIEDIAEAAGISYSHTANKLRAAVKRGDVERVDVHLPGGHTRASFSVTL